MWIITSLSKAKNISNSAISCNSQLFSQVKPCSSLLVHTDMRPFSRSYSYLLENTVGLVFLEINFIHFTANKVVFIIDLGRRVRQFGQEVNESLVYLKQGFYVAVNVVNVIMYTHIFRVGFRFLVDYSTSLSS